MDVERVRERIPERFVAAVAGVTVVLTASLLGVVAAASGATAGFGGRLPYYVLFTAAAFVASLWKLDGKGVDGVTVLIAAAGLAIASGVVVSLAVEGLRFGVVHPERIVASHLLVYFLAAGLVCTGLGMWSLRHWREFTTYGERDGENAAD